MSKRLNLFSTILIAVVILSGSAALGGRKIDKIEFPPLNDIVLPEIDQDTLENGIILYILEDHELPLVNARVRLAAGAYLEPADKVGLAGIAGEVMRTGGTDRMAGDEIDEALESLGASIEVGIGNTSGSANMNIISDYTDTGLEILADILRTPQFDQDKIDLAKTGERTSISSRNDQPLDVCVREFRKIIYGAESPYARQTEYATIDAISRDDLIAFHKNYINPENVMIAIWGDFDKNEMIEKMNKYFGDWSPGPGKVPPLPQVDFEFKPGIHYIEKDNVTQSNILLGHIGGLTGDPDYFALTVANNVLGGSFGGRMFNEVRSKKGLAYSAGSIFSSNISYPGIYYNYVITKLEQTAEASRAVWHEIRRMQTDPPTPDELKKAKDSYLNSFVFNFDSKGEIINRMMDYDYYGFPRDFLQTAKRKIEQITAEDVVDVAKRRFHPDEMHLVVVGIADQFDEPLSVFGPVDSIDITIPSGAPEEEIVMSEEAIARGLELLNKAVEACGGQKNFAKIKSTYSKATVNLTLPQGELVINTENTFELPDKSREVMKNAMFGEIITVQTGEEGWAKQAGKVTELTGEQLEEATGELFRNTLLIFKKMGNPDFQTVFVESADFNGIPVEIVKIISQDGKNSMKLALDASTFMPVAKMYFGQTIMGPANLAQVVSDYRDVSGVKIPFKILLQSDAGNKVADIAIDEYLINPEISENTFTKPE